MRINAEGITEADARLLVGRYGNSHNGAILFTDVNPHIQSLVCDGIGSYDD